MAGPVLPIGLRAMWGSGRRRILSAVLVLAVVGGAIAVTATLVRPAAIRLVVASVPVGPSADGKPVRLDTTLFLPTGTGRHPAVVLAHGFGGSKDDEAADARDLARHGYVVLTYSARGFGRSGGQISLDSARYEVQDARRLIDLLARRRDVVQDHPGDPRVGFAGASYGGALSLLVAGYDRRVDAIVPAITWNDLGQALFPQFAVASGPGTPVTPATPAAVRPQGAGVFKRLWAGLFFGAGSTPTADLLTGRQRPGQAAATPCGRFAADVCAAYQRAATAGVPTPAILALLRRSSPATVLGRIRAPALLIQGETDSLFPLSEADANARGIAATGTPVKVVWYGGGHDGGDGEPSRLRSLTRAWFDRYLQRDGSAADTRFEVTEISAGLSTTDSAAAPTVRSTGSYPGLARPRGLSITHLRLTGPAQTTVSPAGGSPAEVSSLPGLGSALGQLGAGLGSLPGQDAIFDSAPLPHSFRLVGAPSVRVRLSASSTDATVFAKLYDVAPDGSGATLPQQLASPVRLVGLPAAGRTVQISLPALVHEFPSGHRVRLAISSTDQAYALPQAARTYRIALAGDSTVALPSVPLAGAGGVPALLLAGIALVALLLLIAAWWLLRRGRSAARIADSDPGLAGVPLVITGLGKAYGDGFRAVSDLTFRVERTQVVGLLGPNGAGKTTTMRMLLGLIRPSEGDIRVFGHPVSAGAPVLSRVGALVEGPGFLPHLSGRDNLVLFWRATGRSAADAKLDEALAIAGLGSDIERKVRKYSHGMKQRLAIAQAMLGLPDLLVLDEPTDGLDPPQIREMREVLRRYAAGGRTVLVSSHLLAEVEQTCTHCVVMDHGLLVAHGSVAELIGASTSVVVLVDDPARAATVARGLGATDIVTSASGLTLTLDGATPATLVRALVEAGVEVGQLAPQRRLEQAFLSLVGDRGE